MKAPILHITITPDNAEAVLALLKPQHEAAIERANELARQIAEVRSVLGPNGSVHVAKQATVQTNGSANRTKTGRLVKGEGEKIVAAFISEGGSGTTEQIAKLTGVVVVSARRFLNKLRADGKAEKKGKVWNGKGQMTRRVTVADALDTIKRADAHRGN